ncbi:restriction endonuclease subunit S [Corynebacterium tuscaniense]|uniref:restriction endonuclease subunit S n=1 Tax=Corynebacterium tuscaniense TaxID=302449 RepID=UPI000A0770F4|nr:restriction endonuclease subunit S [Corynebacterium tuscaniense]
MSKVDELIRELCPDGVELVALGQLVKFGNGKDHKPLGSGDIPVYGSGGVMRFVDRSIYDEPSVLIPRKGSLGNIFFTEEPFWVVDTVYFTTIDESKIVPKFLYFYLQGLRLQEMNQAGGVPSQTQSRLKKIPINLPPLAVQDEIVRILDQFVELDRELEQEIAGRTVQFNQVREDLISGASFPRVPVGSLATRVSTGATPKAGESRYYQDGDIPWLRTGEVNFGEVWETEKLITQAALDETNVSWIAEHCVIVAISGATAGRVAVNKIPMTTNQHCCNMQINPEQADYRFVFHALAASYEDLKAQGRGARGDLNTSIIKGFKIPLPPIEVQEEIASQLDTFTEYIDNLKRERELRQKQYEHYRDQLLDFPVKE